MANSRAFSSKVSPQDAFNQARAAGYTVVTGQTKNVHGQFVVFAAQPNQQQQQQRNPLYGKI
jgi:hypothetical protein